MQDLTESAIAVQFANDNELDENDYSSSNLFEDSELDNLSYTEQSSR